MLANIEGKQGYGGGFGQLLCGEWHLNECQSLVGRVLILNALVAGMPSQGTKDLFT